jgi:enoyl-CoA hydratase/3-hydroxyacyl-CoA dehydrogenase
MSIENVRKIAVIGAGTMGHGIAEVAAIAGYEVWIHDIADEFLKNAMDKIQWSLQKLISKSVVREDLNTVLSRIHTSTDLEEVARGADFVIEAIPEKLDLKREVFAKLDEYTPPHAILATNTSSLPITEIAEATKRPDKVVGMHFFNPPPLMPLVEIIKGKDTSDLTVRATFELSKKFGKQPVVVNKDVPGFIVNRILARFMNAACWYVKQGKATVVEVDSAIKYKLGFPMGAFELADYSGIDIFHLVAKAMGERGYRGDPCPLFEEKYQAGEYGVKSGKGFYEYPSPGKYSKPNIPKDAGEKVNELEIIAPAINEAAWLLRENIATRDDIDKACELGLGYPKGVLKIADDYGIDAVVETLRKMKEETGREEYNPDPLLVKMVEEEKIGRKTGIGFYEYGKVEEKKLENLILRFEPPIAWVILNRPHRLNALTMELLKELNNTLDELEEREDIRVLIITGAGRAFSAGADVTAFMGVTPFKAAIFSRRFQEITVKLEYYTKPVIMALNGFTLGGGMEIALCGDFRIASELAMVGQPEINLGIMPGAGGTQRMARLIGASKAKEVIYTGDMIPAPEAHKLGIVDKVVPPEKLEDEARKLALKLAEKPPLGLLAAKYSIQFGLETNIWTGLAIEAGYFGLLFSTDDFIEGVTAFMEKRKPKFKGK